MPVRLSSPGKIPCFSWSLQAVDHCPGSRLPGKKNALVEACEGCYAREGNYRFTPVIALRMHNAQDWQRDAWTDDMVGALANELWFRWFDSGDMYSIRLAWKIYEVMLRTPQVRHWLPTRMAKFPRFAKVIEAMRALPNVVVRFSSDSVTGDFTKGLHGSVIYPADETPPKGTLGCEAYTRGGKCGECRACWEKTKRVIAYPSHGNRIKRVIALKLAA